MSDVVWIRSKNICTDLESFTEAKKRLMLLLEVAKTDLDFEKITTHLSELLKNQNYNPEEKNEFKKIRQKIYDRKRQMKLVTEDESVPTTQTSDFINIQKLKLLIFLIPLLIVSILVYLQSLELYKLSRFHQPELAAFGALFMVLGFSAYHAGSKSLLSLALCLYAGGYETYLMTSGTFYAEKVLSLEDLEKNEELVFLKEKIDVVKSHYLELKTKYENPSSKFFENAWFKQKQLNPALTEYEEAQKKYFDKKEKLSLEKESSANSWLKVFYRLGLVLLSMVLIHSFIQRVKWV